MVGKLLTIFTPKNGMNPVPGWYRKESGIELEDVTDEAENPLLGIIAILVEPPAELSYRICQAEIVLVGVNIIVDVFQSKGSRDSLYLGIPTGVNLHTKIQAQVLRYVEKLIENL